MRLIASGGLFAAALALAYASGASAQNTPVEKSGNTYHRAVCARAVAHAAQCHAHVVTDPRGHTVFSMHPPVGGYGPADLRDAYKVSATGSSSTIIAIVDAFGYPYAMRDLKVYRKNFGLPACTKANGCFGQFNQNGAKKPLPGFNLGWAQEMALDLDMASAMCPNCKIYLVEANSNSYTNLAAAVNSAANVLQAHVISNSYGGGESGTSGYEASYNHAGVAVTASSGDSGYGVEFPASSPHVIAVGGTHLTRDGSSRGWAESAWSGAGSGCSTVYAKPAWQTDGGCGKRTVADVSAIADPNTGVAVYGPVNSSQAAGWMVFGGTSVAAPLIGGIYGANGGAVNYGSDPYSHTSDLFDVTSGSNGSCGGSYLCTAQPGYDGPTGLGTPNGINAF
jgi:subtilase family serine protease